MPDQINLAVESLRRGGVIAYPTEHCYGLGCDPQNEAAVRRLVNIKQRKIEQGVLLIAASIPQVEIYADLNSSPLAATIKASWPGPHTWTLPPSATPIDWLIGRHSSIAIRISAHPVCLELCERFDGAIVSSSANRHGKAVLMNADDVEDEIGDELDFIVRASVGGAPIPSEIRDGQSGEVIR